MNFQKQTFCFLIFFVINISGFTQTIKIGTQKWMSQNLNVEKFRNGDPMPEAKTAEEWSAFEQAGEAAWCYYNNDEANGNIYGKLYNFFAIVDKRGLAPKGYHVPSDEEWTTLITNLGGESIAGIKMKSKQGWLQGGIGTNSSCFSGLPGGMRSSANGGFFNIESNSYWWSSTEGSKDGDAKYAWHRTLYYSSSIISRFYENKASGLSVRCIKD